VDGMSPGKAVSVFVCRGGGGKKIINKKFSGFGQIKTTKIKNSNFKT
jgi:hypothetical protein